MRDMSDNVLNISKLIADAARAIVQADDHETDADCAMFLIDDTCTECGVYHGDPCPGCGGRGYHVASCSMEKIG